VACKGAEVRLKCLKKFAISSLSNLSINLSLDAGLKRRFSSNALVLIRTPQVVKGESAGRGNEAVSKLAERLYIR
jgi:hypothetical protein